MVTPFNESTLAISLKNSYTSETAIKQKNHFKYLLEYLGPKGLNAKTLVEESEYISRDYLHDYATYYSLCFQNYPKFCKRIHLFSSDFTQEVFDKEILSDESTNTSFWDHYLGFIVVKPIPVMLIGFSVLKTYQSNKPTVDRNYWGLKKYPIHLFGKKIEIASLAFQEQDKVLAACATTAIWSMLNKLSDGYFPTLKSPSRITQDADKLSSDGSRLFPNKGLSVWQICQAISSSGFVSEVKKADHSIKLDKKTHKVFSNQLMKEILWAYSGIGIPIILVIQIPTTKGFRTHAITVCGHKISSKTEDNDNSKELKFSSDKISKFYAHDDQWGPFTRIKFIGENEIETTWSENDRLKRSSYVSSAIISIYPKIRISYEDVKALVIGLNVIFSGIVLPIFSSQSIEGTLAWDIQIKYAEHYKKDIKNSNLEEKQKREILFSSLPRYVWVAKCKIDDQNELLHFVFDATNVADAMIGLKVLCFVPKLIPLIYKILDSRKNVETAIKHRLREEYFKFLLEQFSNKGRP